MVEEIAPVPPLPIEGWADVDMPVDRMWEIFLDVPGWASWNPCIWKSRMRGGELREGATLVWAFNPIRRRYLYKMPATAEIVEVVPAERVTWEVKAPGFHALHSYRFEAAGPRPLPLRLVGSRGGAYVPGDAALLAGALPVRVPGVAGGGECAACLAAPAVLTRRRFALRGPGHGTRDRRRRVTYLACSDCGKTFYSARAEPGGERCVVCGGELTTVDPDPAPKPDPGPSKEG